jgi:NAD(P)-dependent dehydrogenase (short-subunit alcohol dehydrogenase family)
MFENFNIEASMDNLFRVENKIVAITGGAGVLCSEIAISLAKAGARVCILDSNINAAETVCKQIQSGSGTAIAIKSDVLKKEELQDSLKTVIKNYGVVDILINGAGGNKKEATASNKLNFFDIEPAAIRAVIDLNLLGTILPCQVFGGQMAKQGQGIIINISSMNAFRPLTNIAAYSAAKAAVSNFTQWLAVYMCRNYSKDIRVNAIAPGFFLTEQNRFLLTDEKSGDLTERGKTIIEHTPMGRFGIPGDLTGTLLWLVSDASKFVTGAVIPVDGGFNAFSGV